MSTLIAAPARRPVSPRPTGAVRGVRTVDRLCHRLAGWSVVALVLVAVGVAGLVVRRWAWDQSEPMRYTTDINNAFRQGTRTLATGYVERYDNELLEPQHQWVMGLDYGPGRLAIATLWARWVRSHVTAPAVGPDPATDQWTVEFYARARELGLTYALCRPLLMVNLTGEILSAVAVFLLVRWYASQAGRRPVRGNALATVAASLLWLDPALISNAHMWPQWDSWVLPFFLWAVLLASWDLWFCAGVVIAAGAMFKGQVLFGAPLLLLWPIWQGRIGAVARWTTGLAAGVAAATAVWLVRSPGGMPGTLYLPGHTNPAAVRWVADAAVAALLVLLAMRARFGPWGPPRGAGWTGRSASAGQLLVGVAGLVAALMTAAAACAVGVWLTVSLSVAIGLTVVAGAALTLAWAAVRVGLVPVVWADRLARPPRPLSRLIRATLLATAGVAVVLPLRAVGVHPLWPAAIAVAGLAAATWAVPARSLGHVTAAWLAAALFLCLRPEFGGSGQWFSVGIAHGTTARVGLSLGDNNNLPKLLQDVWGWQLETPVPHTLPPGRAGERVFDFLRSIDRRIPPAKGTPVGLPLKYVLLLVWIAALAACSVAAARHDRRRDARFLVAVAAPWVAMFAVVGQMHQRYLLWGAAMTSMSAAVNPGLVVLHLLLSLVSAGQEFGSMMGGARQPDTPLWRLVRGYTPGMAWAVLLSAGVFVYVAVTPGRRPELRCDTDAGGP